MVLLVVDTEYSSLLAARAQHFLYCLDNMCTHLYIQTHISTQLIRIWFVCHTQKQHKQAFFTFLFFCQIKAKKQQNKDMISMHLTVGITYSHMSVLKKDNDKRSIFTTAVTLTVWHIRFFHTAHTGFPEFLNVVCFSVFTYPVLSVLISSLHNV